MIVLDIHIMGRSRCWKDLVRKYIWEILVNSHNSIHYIFYTPDTTFNVDSKVDINKLQTLLKSIWRRFYTVYMYTYTGKHRPTISVRSWPKIYIQITRPDSNTIHQLQWMAHCMISLIMEILHTCLPHWEGHSKQIPLGI